MLKRNILLCIIAICSVVHIYGQQDKILLRIDQEEISRSAFEAAYKRHVLSNPDDFKNINDFLPQFINNKLKITEAKALGLNTSPGFRLKVKEYNESQQMTHPGEKSLHDLLSADGTLKDSHSAERFQVMQIYKYVPQNCSAIELEKSKQLIHKWHSELINKPEADFKAYVEEYSDDKRCLELSRMEMNPEFEQAVCNLQKGEISVPFLTSQGLHIVKLLDKISDTSESERKKMALVRLKKRYRNEADPAFLKKLKDVYHYSPELNSINELLASGSTDKVLFTLDEKTYTGADFRYFAQSNPKGIKRQFNDFVTKSLMDCEYKVLGTVSPDNHLSVKEYEEELLLSEINHREVIDKARMDQAGLAAYFSVHKKDYRWPHPRFRGVVLHARDKAIIREAKKRVKKQPVEQWGTLIEEYFNIGAVQHVEVEQGTYKVGDNIYVDDLVFKKGNATSPSSYPFTAVIGKKIKGPENYNEILTQLVPDYEKFLETQWMKRLHKAYSVEINEEVLKTVNNH